MKKSVAKLWKILPLPIKNAARKCRAQWINREQCKEIYRLLSNEKTEGIDEEQAAAFDYLSEKKRWCVYPGEYAELYNNEALFDIKKSDDNFFYAVLGGKNLYFPKKYGQDTIRQMCKSRLLEQDRLCPHCYFSQECLPPQKGEVLFDIGAAEALISLQYVDVAAHVYIFECDQDWMDALHKTFEPWKEKVSIINLYVGNKTADGMTRIDDFVCANPQLQDSDIVIKMDIEGAELAALEGCADTIARKNVRFSVCTYHQPGDAEKFKFFFEKRGFKTEFSKNYMLFKGLTPSEYCRPYLRKGMIRAWKEIK